MKATDGKCLVVSVVLKSDDGTLRKVCVICLHVVYLSSNPLFPYSCQMTILVIFQVELECVHWRKKKQEAAQKLTLTRIQNVSCGIEYTKA